MAEVACHTNVLLVENVPLLHASPHRFFSNASGLVIQFHQFRCFVGQGQPKIWHRESEGADVLNQLRHGHSIDQIYRGFINRSHIREFIRAINQFVVPHHRTQTRQIADLHSELASLRKELTATREQLSDQFDRLVETNASFEHRARRDLGYASERDAAKESAELVWEQMQTASSLPDRRATLLHALTLVQVEGMALEFGVCSGTTLKIIVSELPSRKVYGFDSFQGLPEDWNGRFRAGSFSLDKPPEVSGAEIVTGWFNDTLPGFVAEHPEPVAFLHVDCDIYSSTKTVLEHIGPHLIEGSIVVFDEFFNYPGWREHEYRAWMEYVEEKGLEFKYEGYTADHEQVVVRVTRSLDLPLPAHHAGRRRL